MVALPAAAQETPLDALEKEMDELAHKTKEELIQKIHELTQENQVLKRRVDEHDRNVGGAEYDYEALQRENHQLKKALRAFAIGNASPMVEPGPEQLEGPPDSAQDSGTRPSVPGLEYEVVKEWGRSPEDAARLPNKPPSMKGMAVYMKGELSNENSHTYVWFGSAMKQIVAGYDNVIIECFRTRAAAMHYAETGEIIHSARVLSMSRQEGSNEDTILGYGSKGKFVVKNPV
jgi:hypothetical protein